MSVEEIAAAEGEDEPLFAEIRRRGEVAGDPAAVPHHPPVRGGQAEHLERLRVRRVDPAAARPHRAGRRGGGGAVSAGSASPAGAPARVRPAGSHLRHRLRGTAHPQRQRPGDRGAVRPGRRRVLRPAQQVRRLPRRRGPQARLQRRRHAAPRPAVLQGVLRDRRGRRGVQRRAGAAGAAGAQDAGRRERPHARLHHLDVVHAVPQGAVRPSPGSRSSACAAPS